MARLSDLIERKKYNLDKRDPALIKEQDPWKNTEQFRSIIEDRIKKVEDALNISNKYFDKICSFFEIENIDDISNLKRKSLAALRSEKNINTEAETQILIKYSKISKCIDSYKSIKKFKDRIKNRLKENKELYLHDYYIIKSIENDINKLNTDLENSPGLWTESEDIGKFSLLGFDNYKQFHESPDKQKFPTQNDLLFVMELALNRKNDYMEDFKKFLKKNSQHELWLETESLDEYERILKLHYRIYLKARMKVCFIEESSILYDSNVFPTTSASFCTVLQLLDVISDKKKLDSNCVLLSNKSIYLINNKGNVISKSARIRYIFSAKLIIQIVSLFIISYYPEKHQLFPSIFECTLNEPLKYIPYLIAEELDYQIYCFNLENEAELGERICYFLNNFVDTISQNPELVTALHRNNKFIKDVKLSNTEINRFFISMNPGCNFEVKYNYEYDKESDILNIRFSDEIIVDLWCGKDSFFIALSNYVYYLRNSFFMLFIGNIKRVTDKKGKDQFWDQGILNFASYDSNKKFNDTLKSIYKRDEDIVNKAVNIENIPNNSEQPESQDFFYRFNEYKKNDEKNVPAADFFYHTNKNLFGECIANKVKNELNSNMSEVVFGEDFSHKDLMSCYVTETPLSRDPTLIAGFQKPIITKKMGNTTITLVSDMTMFYYFEKISKDVDSPVYIPEYRSPIFTTLEMLLLSLLKDQSKVCIYPFFQEYINLVKKNITNIDKIKHEQKKKEQEAKLLVRNLRHSINNASESVLANLKEAIDIINKTKDSKKTISHLYSCNDEIAVLRNTVLKFCHDIVDKNSINELYLNSFSDVQPYENITIRKLVLSSIFMAIKQILNNLKFNRIRELYSQNKIKNISGNDELFGKFIEYLKLRYNRDFSKLSEEDIKNNNTLNKDYVNYQLKVKQTSDLENLYEEISQQKKLDSVIPFSEKFFFSKMLIDINCDRLKLREASYASYLFSDLFNELCLNIFKYAAPDSDVQIIINLNKDMLEAEFINFSNSQLTEKYGTETGLKGQTAVVKKIGGNLTYALDEKKFDLRLSLPIS